MKAAEIALQLLTAHGSLRARDLIEASVRRPPRGKIWVGTFTGPEPGRQIWRSTGRTDREQALALARQWERQAREQRKAMGLVRAKPTIRVQHRPAEVEGGPLTQAETARMLGLSERAVRNIERRALAKLLRHPQLRQLWREYLAGK